MTDIVAISNFNEETLDFLVENGHLLKHKKFYEHVETSTIIYVGRTLEFSETKIFNVIQKPEFNIERPELNSLTNVIFVNDHLSLFFSGNGVRSENEDFFVKKISELMEINDEKIVKYIKRQTSDMYNIFSKACMILCMYFNYPKIKKSMFYKTVKSLLQKETDDFNSFCTYFNSYENIIQYKPINIYFNNETLYIPNIPSLYFYNLRSKDGFKHNVDDFLSTDSINRFETNKRLPMILENKKYYSDQLNYMFDIGRSFLDFDDNNEIKRIVCGENLKTDCGVIMKSLNIELCFIGTSPIKTKNEKVCDPICINVNGQNIGVLQSNHLFAYNKSEIAEINESYFISAFTNKLGASFLYENGNFSRKKVTNFLKMSDFEYESEDNFLLGDNENLLAKNLISYNDRTSNDFDDDQISEDSEKEIFSPSSPFKQLTKNSLSPLSKKFLKEEDLESVESNVTSGSNITSGSEGSGKKRKKLSENQKQKKRKYKKALKEKKAKLYENLELEDLEMKAKNAIYDLQTYKVIGEKNLVDFSFSKSLSPVKIIPLKLTEYEEKAFNKTKEFLIASGKYNTDDDVQSYINNILEEQRKYNKEFENEFERDEKSFLKKLED